MTDYNPGFYTDLFQTSSGCDSIIYTNITVLPNINITQDTILCYGDSIIVGSNVYWTEGLFYDTISSENSCDSIITTNIETSYIEIAVLWNNNELEANIINGIPLYYLWSNGDTTSSINPTTSDIYWCLVTDVNGCLSDTAFYDYNVHSLLDETANSLDIFPNPTNGLVNINFYNIFPTTLKVQDILGKVIYETYISDKGFIIKQIDISDYSSGVYIIELSSEYGFIHKKIILE